MKNYINFEPKAYTDLGTERFLNERSSIPATFYGSNQRYVFTLGEYFCMLILPACT